MAEAVDDLRLGYLAIQAEFINLAELKWCLQVQAEASPPPPLGKVLVREGYLAQRDLEYLLMVYAARVKESESAEERGNTPPDPLLLAPELTIERIERAVVARLGRALKSGTFGRFKILGQVGRGGMGVVLKAEDDQGEEPVAVKLLVGAGGATVKDIERFKKEAAIMAQIRHANIVQIYDVGREKGLDFIVMEFIDGISLAELLDARLPTVEETVSIGKDMAAALQFIQQRGIFHRDLKPANIMLEKSGRAVLMDFGLAVFDKFEVKGPRTGSVGTPQYQPPEQAEVGGRFGKIGPWSDVYGLGATLYHLLTGAPPFEGTDRGQIRRQVLTQEPPEIRRLNPKVPEAVAEVIETAMAKRAEDRYAAPAEFGKALGALLDKISRPAKRRPMPPPKKGWFG
jgi:serine/threonine protein kinase